MIMNKKELQNLLNNYTYFQDEIENCNQEILNLAEVIDAERDIKVSELSGMPKGYGISDEVAKKAERIVDIYCKQIAKVETKIEKLFKDKNTVEHLIEVLDELERKIIELKYFKKYKPWMICSSINYSRGHMFKIHDKAINKMLEYYNNHN